jgi:hypothetical protein
MHRFNRERPSESDGRGIPNHESNLGHSTKDRRLPTLLLPWPTEHGGAALYHGGRSLETREPVHQHPKRIPKWFNVMLGTRRIEMGRTHRRQGLGPGRGPRPDAAPRRSTGNGEKSPVHRSLNPDGDTTDTLHSSRRHPQIKPRLCADSVLAISPCGGAHLSSTLALSHATRLSAPRGIRGGFQLARTVVGVSGPDL